MIHAHQYNECTCIKTLEILDSVRLTSSKPLSIALTLLTPPCLCMFTEHLLVCDKIE